MARTAPVLASLLFGIVAISGCAGSDASSPASRTEASSVVEATADAGADAGSIQGTVVDDSLAPLKGAQVALLDQKLTASTDDGGSFSFKNLAPGSYKLAAAALGYESAAKAVTVEASQPTSVQFVLTAIAIKEEYVEVKGPYAWFFDCRAGTPVVTGSCFVATGGPNDKADLRFNMSEDAQAFVGELRWAPGSFATSKALRMSFSYVGRPSTHWYCTATSPSPLQWHYDMDEGCLSPVYCGIGASQGTSGEHSKPNMKEQLLTYTNTPFGCTSDPTHVVELSIQQKMEAILTIFHNGPKPEVYTAFPDN